MRARTPIAELLEAHSLPIQIVATPGSGNGQALAMVRRLHRTLAARARRVEVDVFSDLDALHRWATAGTRRCSLLIAVGGDGTQDTAALAAIRRDAALLPVPSGFGDLFTRALEQPRRVDRVLELLENGRLIDVDVGVRAGRTFVCQESFGLLAQIEDAVAEAGKPRARWRRWVAYYEMAMRYLWRMSLPPMHVSVDGRLIARDAVIVTVANVATYGPWLPLTPAASPIDGRFDVFVMRRAAKRIILARLLKRQLHLPVTDGGSLVCRGQHVSIVGPHHARHELTLLARRLPVVVSPAAADALERDLTAPDEQVPRVA